MRVKLRRVKEGEVLLVGDVAYRIGETSAQAINVLIEVWERDLEIDDAVHLYRADGRDGDLIPVSKIKTALEHP